MTPRGTFFLSFQIRIGILQEFDTSIRITRRHPSHMVKIHYSCELLKERVGRDFKHIHHAKKFDNIQPPQHPIRFSLALHFSAPSLVDQREKSTPRQGVTIANGPPLPSPMLCTAFLPSSRFATDFQNGLRVVMWGGSFV